MKLVAWIPLLLLAGCTTYVSHGSWLDGVGKPPQPPLAMTDEDARAVSAEAALLRAQAEAVRDRLAHEADRRERIRDYRELNAIGLRLRPLERQLEDAGRSAFTGTVPAAPG